MWDSHVGTYSNLRVPKPLTQGWSNVINMNITLIQVRVAGETSLLVLTTGYPLYRSRAGRLRIH